MTILLAEDNPKTRRLIIQMLQQNFKEIDQIHECEDGREAVTLYRQVNPDWVLMDINLKVVDGLQAAREITHIDADAKVVMVTLYDGPEYREAASLAGACGYIRKENMIELVNLLKGGKHD